MIQPDDISIQIFTLQFDQTSIKLVLDIGETCGKIAGFFYIKFMLKITKTPVTRLMTEDEFRRQKNGKPYKTLRTMAKSCNFLLIFGGSGSVLSQQALETSWSEDQIDEYLKDNDCEKELEFTQRVYGKRCDTTQCKYIAVATHIRSNFFKGYPGLLERCDREVNYAETNGYCRSVFGMTRNFIELMLKGKDDEEKISAILRNISNQAKNVRMQNYEACVRGRAMYEMQQWLINTGRKSWIWNEIHDSVDFYIHKQELKEVMAHAKHLFERKIPELLDGWVPLRVDCEISDLNDKNHHDYYKGGRDPIEFGLDWKGLEYEDPDPFNVELTEDLEEEYFKERRKYWENKKEKDPLEDICASRL